MVTRSIAPPVQSLTGSLPAPAAPRPVRGRRHRRPHPRGVRCRHRRGRCDCRVDRELRIRRGDATDGDTDVRPGSGRPVDGGCSNLVRTSRISKAPIASSCAPPTTDIEIGVLQRRLATLGGDVRSPRAGRAGRRLWSCLRRDTLRCPARPRPAAGGTLPSWREGTVGDH